MSNVDIDRVRLLVKALADFEEVDEFAKEHGLGDVTYATALNPELSRVIMKARVLRKELEDNALNLARALIETLDKGTPGPPPN